MKKRYKLMIMYQALPTKKGMNRQIDIKLESDIKKLAKKYHYKFIGSGYDFTNKRRDLEYEA